MSIARLQASLAQATNEVTVAAANINFDFCLVKYDAPKEYQPIGELLSTSRKQDAEQGMSHVTARRMAALFDGICPDTPSLIRAYGERVSEISKKATDQETKSYSASIFGPYTGIDATSIWAAATSSPTASSGAIHVHLLACLLALMFDAAEATSIWAELIEERRKAIAASWERDEAIPFSTAAAAVQQGISRKQLAEWDASARAWLQTADTIMLHKQTQLRLILKNVNLSMGSETKVYLSVISAWKKTLMTMERLVNGVPQEVHDGSAILGLAAWHIYPDISVFGPRNVDVHMNDPLVASGGILSLGCSPSATTPRSGVTWSLSLSQLKYYGDPVRTMGTFKPDPARITFDQLLLATMGCILAQWHVPTSRVDTVEAIKILSKLSQNYVRTFSIDTGNRIKLPNNLDERVEGLRLLSQAAQIYLDDAEGALPFINLGRNRTAFLPPRTNLEGVTHKFLRPFMDLHNIEVLLESMRDADGRIQFLRRIAARAGGLESIPTIIQYSDNSYRDLDTPNYATVFPEEGEYMEPSPTRRTVSHSRWVHESLVDAYKSGERILENKNYSIYSPFPGSRLHCKHKPKLSDEAITMKLWYGEGSIAAIYICAQGSQTPVYPKITRQDLLWCLEHDLLSPENILRQTNDSVMKTLECLAMVWKNAFRTISGPAIQVKTLARPLIDAVFMKEFQESKPRIPQICQAVSILSYLIAGHDMLCSKIPTNVVGVSIGNSIFVPEQLLRDPMVVHNKGSFTRILGNIGKPGFVMFFSVKNPKIPPSDDTFWRDANPAKFDGRAMDLFQNTSMHLSFTNWERPIEDFSSGGNQDVQLTLMECVISIRERGKWIGDVDVVAALKSSLIYQLPPQKPCNHSKLEPPDIEMKSIESWDELREFHAGNNVVRANRNWLARLATTAYLAQHAQAREWNIRRITLCPDSVCWKCMEKYAKDFSGNIYIF